MTLTGNRKLLVALGSIAAFVAMAFFDQTTSKDTMYGIVAVVSGFYGGNAIENLKKLKKLAEPPHAADEGKKGA